MFHPDPAAAIEVILLAAGVSARMAGADKRLLMVGGEPLLRRSARTWLEAGHAVLVVIREDDAAATDALAGLPVRLVGNPRAGEGQNTSIAAGLAAATLASRGCAIALADQPLLEAADLAALLATFDAQHGGAIVVPRHGGERGNPVLLPAAIARALRDDPSLGPPRRYIDTRQDQVRWHEAANDHFTADLDTPDDVRRLLGADPFPAKVPAP